MARGHDQPNPALIIEGPRRPQPSKRVQGQDYPVSVIEKLQKRDRGTVLTAQIIGLADKLFKGITKAPELPELQESSENIIDEFLDTNEKGKTYMRDMMKPVGDACRDDGTLKEANEMVWPDSPTALEAPQDNFREYDEIYVGFQDETDSIDLPNIKVNSVLCF